MPARRGLSIKTRFDVFKRDGFTCQYCGRQVPEVVLEVDHIIPLAKGGGDEIENLITACWDCNRGKRDGLLDERAPLRDMGEQADLIRERERQLSAYNAAKAEELERKEREFTMVWNYWFDLWNAETLERWCVPWKGPLKNAIERLGAVEVMEAMDIARDKFNYPSSAPAKYFGGVIQRRIARLEGRIVPCTVCGKDVVLEPGDDPRLRWFHTSCKEGDRG